MGKFIPLLQWLPRYRREDLRGDLNAGLTVAVMLIPQGMAYALLAGLPPIVGLYASLVPLVVYALFGTSRQLAVGPVAMVSLMTAAGLSPLAVQGGATYVVLAAILAALVGLIQLVMGLSRLGFLVNFLAHPVISGFTSAAALIIGFSQLKHLLGIPLPTSHRIDLIVWSAVQHLSRTNLLTLLIGSGSILGLWLLKRWKPLIPGTLIMVVGSTLLVWILRLDLRGVSIVGEVPRGLPGLRIPAVTQENLQFLRDLWPTALAIALVGFMESIAVAKAFASKNRYSLDANQELVGLGAANMAAALFGAYPVTGGFSRTAVNAQAGSRTPLASIITALVVSLTLLLFTPLFYYLPTAVLAAIIMVAVAGLVDIAEFRHLLRIRSTDLLLLLLSFFATLLLGMIQGVLVGVGVSLLLVIYRSLRPHWTLLGRLPGTQTYRSIQRYPQAETFDGLVIFRLDADLYFANIAILQQRLEQIGADYGSSLKAILFDFQSVNHLDSTADRVLQEMALDYRSRHIDVYFSNVKGPVRDLMNSSGFCQQLGRECFFLNNHEAVRHFLDHGENTPVQAGLPLTLASSARKARQQAPRQKPANAFIQGGTSHD